jgi:hypothetical protein
MRLAKYAASSFRSGERHGGEETNADALLARGKRPVKRRTAQTANGRMQVGDEFDELNISSERGECLFEFGLGL